MKELRVNSIVRRPKYTGTVLGVVTNIENDRSYPFTVNNDTYDRKKLKAELSEGIGKFLYVKSCYAYVDRHSNVALAYLTITCRYDNNDEVHSVTIPTQENTLEEDIAHTIRVIEETYSDKHKEHLKEKQREVDLKSDAKKYKIDTSDIIFSRKESINITLDDKSSIQDQYLSIVDKSTSSIDKINSLIKVGEQEELAKAFLKAKNEISKYSSKESSKITTFVTKLFGESKYAAKISNKVKNAYTEASSVKDVIDHVFGLMHEKYKKLIQIAGDLQLSRDTLEGQVKALQVIEKESDLEVSEYPDITRVPSKDLALNTNIKGAIKKYEQRLLKVEGALTAMQGTIVSLGRDLPAHKADLEEEMAIGGLLSNVDDYQKMYTEIKILVTEVTDATREQTHGVVNNLMRLQIEDTHTLQLVGKNLEAGTKFAKMLATNSTELANKVINDSKYINAVVNGLPLDKAKQYLK